MSTVFLTPRQIYDALTGGPGAESLGNAQIVSSEEANRESDRARRIVQLGRTIQSGWQGSAADGAVGAAAPLADAALLGADALERAQNLLDRQSGSFQRAANSVVPVADDLPEMDVGDVLNPVDYEQEVRRHQADAEHNMQIFEGYDNESSYNETYAPREYPIINHSGGTVSVTAGDTAGGDGPGSGGDSPRRGGDGDGVGGPSGAGSPGGGSPAGGSPGSWQGGGDSPGGIPAPGPGGGQQTRPNDYVPPAVSPPAGYQPPALQPGLSTGSTGGFPAGVPVGGYPGGGGSGGGSGPRGRGGAPGGAGPRGGGIGADGGAGSRGPGGGVGAGTPGEAARGGTGGVAGARGGGAPGAMGAAPMGAGRGKDDDDSEHDRKYLVEPDPEETFGSEVLTAPQVIGDDEYEDD